MDKKDQPGEPVNEIENKVSLLRQTMVPAGIILTGGIVIALLYYFLFLKNHSFDSLDSNFLTGQAATGAQEGQESFQAPADLSVALQQECQSSVEKLNHTESCSEQEKEFFLKNESCSGYAFNLEQPQKVSISEGFYSDLIFSLIECYKETNQVSSILNLIQKGQQLKPWDSQIGATSCSSHNVLKAHQVALSSKLLVCSDRDQVHKIIEEIKNKNYTYLNQFINPMVTPTMGSSESEFNCPETLESIQTGLASVAHFSIQLEAAPEVALDKKEGQDIFISFKKEQETQAILNFGMTESNCLYLKGFFSTIMSNPE